MEWRPIEEYDWMKTKPKRVVFLVAAVLDRWGKIRLDRSIVTERFYGLRTTTHFTVLPDFPEDSK